MIKTTKTEMRDFAAMVRGDHPDELAWRDFVLRELRLGIMRIELVKNEIKAIGIALKAGIIDPNLALNWLRDANGIHFLYTGGDDELDNGQAIPSASDDVHTGGQIEGTGAGNSVSSERVPSPSGSRPNEAG